MRRPDSSRHQRAKPKSAILTHSLDASSTFSHLRSRWLMSSECRGIMLSRSRRRALSTANARPGKTHRKRCQLWQRPNLLSFKVTSFLIPPSTCLSC
ncbi:Protein of unknown function, partial [Gryllus bimaculatus]